VQTLVCYCATYELALTCGHAFGVWPTVSYGNLRRTSYVSSRRCTDLEQSSAAYHICSVTSRLLLSLEDILLRTLLPAIIRPILSCPRSDTVIYGHVNRSYTYLLFLLLRCSSDVFLLELQLAETGRKCWKTRSSAVAERPRDAPCRWKCRCHSRSLKVIRNYTVE